MNLGIACESMKFNDYLKRNKTSLISDKRQQLLSELIHSTTRDEDENDDEDQDENFDTDENKIEILEWEKEWWQKVDAKLNS